MADGGFLNAAVLENSTTVVVALDGERPIVHAPISVKALQQLAADVAKIHEIKTFEEVDEWAKTMTARMPGYDDYVSRRANEHRYLLRHGNQPA